GSRRETRLRRNNGSEGAGAVPGEGTLGTETGSSRGEGGPSGPRPETIFALAGIAIIIFTEAFFLKDYLGGIYYRMNTVFKFYNIAWILMGISALIIVARYLGSLDLPRFPAITARAAAVVSAVVLLLAIPAFFVAGGGSYMPTLDGLQYLENTHPADARALPFVRGLPPGTVIAEGVKGDYDYPSRISAFTGVQTILGWTGHEFMWRGAPADTGGRAAEVKAVYEDPARAPGVLRKYNVSYVYVGDTERELYPQLDLPLDHLAPVYASDGVTIYRFTG
ncbi:MAG TPA: DUF2298 domain-containing protein, partial [Methanomicrobiales archaeon]|nr:DUF2298 domain-containing protein [Methanomicrobiales archaeon]